MGHVGCVEEAGNEELEVNAGAKRQFQKVANTMGE